MRGIDPAPIKSVVLHVSNGLGLSFRIKRVPPNMDFAMNRSLKSGFPPFDNEQSLQSAIESICASFGNVAELKILSARREPGLGLQCACFLRMDTSEADTKLKSKFKVIDFGDELAFFADVDEAKWAGPRSW